MARIRVLDEVTRSKIAAGEVVERPASVVKELVENSIDADAGSVSVAIEDGGRKLIRVSDDGVGMDGEDLRVAVERHATSKISGVDDIWRIETLGFRGEALPSIGAVSSMSISSRPRGGGGGASIAVEGGAASPVRAAGVPEGTTVEVRNLFFNTPARLKFLRSAGAETRAITDAVIRLALARPRVAFELRSGPREVFKLPPAETARDRVRAIFGGDLAKTLLAVESPGPVHVAGYVAAPPECRANSSGQYVFLNGRPVVEKTVSAAVGEATRGLLPERRFPIFFLWIAVDPAEVDVNVHPAKREVRFRDRGRVFSAVGSAVGRVVSAQGVEGARSGAGSAALYPAASGLRAIDSGAPETDQAVLSFGRSAAIPSQETAMPQPPPDIRAAPPVDGSAGTFAGRFVGVLRGTYLVLETGRGALLVDQHALHERVIYEELLASREILSQRLLIPEVRELSPVLMQVFEERGGVFGSLGFEVERFGPGAVAVHAVPGAASGADGADAVCELLEKLADELASVDADALRREALKTVACHAAVKAGRGLAGPEAASLLAAAGSGPNSSVCPHGRPTAVLIGWEDLEKRFARR